jgi:hypothetical protein
MKGFCRKMSNIALLESWLSVYANKINTGVKFVHVALKVSPRKEKGEAKICNDTGMQTEGIIESTMRKQQSDVGKQTDAQTEVKMLTKRKEISPNGDSQISRKRHRQIVGSYAEVCFRGDNRSVNNRRRRLASRRGTGSGTTREADGATTGDMTGNNERHIQVRQQTRRREAVMVKVPDGTGWLQTYKKIVDVKEMIQEMAEVRKTRSGHVLIEINRQGTASEVAERLKLPIGQEMEIIPLLNRTTIEVKNIDPLSTREDLVRDICMDLDI